MVFLLVLTSVFAANYANTIVMDKTNFDVQLYNCDSDNACANPDLVSESHASSNSYEFKYFTDDYYAEYLFKEGYRAKGFIVHKYSRKDSFTFDKREQCSANIKNMTVSDLNPDQGDIIREDQILEHLLIDLINTETGLMLTQE
ncbi:hypothetical protein J4427_02295 [Candidatus Woesearchaeota archaeon]|nr:hypothetical protein [Candidatus Woesearchaeota archaeon]